MIAIAITITFITLGFILQKNHKQFASKIKPLSQKINFYLLLALISFLFANKQQNIILGIPFILGITIQLFPALLGLLFKKKSPNFATDLLIFSSYGGGNRGVLLLTLFEPSLLPLFIIIDLGNFISLLLIYPLLIRLNDNTNLATKQKKSAWWDIVLILIAIASGFALRAWDNNFIPLLNTMTKQLITISIALYLGLQFNPEILKHPCLLLKRMFAARIVGLLLPTVFCLTCYYLGWLNEIDLQASLIIVALFVLLPVSSLVPVMLEHSSIHKQVVDDVVGSSGLYLLALIFLSLLKTILNISYV
ncbi:MAG: hypothetical protein WCK96_17575 [Methylococcales bacterium]